MFSVDMNVLMASLETEDDVGAVLRMHLVFEKFLDWTFDHYVTEEKKACIQRPTNYRGKISMAAALGLPVALATAINQLNNVRNSLAHRMEKINVSQVEQYGREVNKLVSIKKDFVPLENRKIEMDISKPEKVYKFGAGNVHMDFAIASLALLAVALTWSAKVQLIIPIDL